MSFELARIKSGCAGKCLHWIASCLNWQSGSSDGWSFGKVRVYGECDVGNVETSSSGIDPQQGLHKSLQSATAIQEFWQTKGNNDSARNTDCYPVKCNPYVIIRISQYLGSNFKQTYPSFRFRDPLVYENSTEFNPDRFSADARQELNKCAFLPFGLGPRMCFGMKFGLLQSKYGLVNILQKYQLKLSKRTETPLRISKQSFLLSPVGGLWLEFIRRWGVTIEWV